MPNDLCLQIVARVKVGANAQHIYSVSGSSSAWTHSDAEGVFYVFNVTQEPTNWTAEVQVSLVCMICWPLTYNGQPLRRARLRIIKQTEEALL